ncbi:MAG: ribosome small subunit-dependent GTPase A [Eubacteriales bacterium]|nr:ribosome small subunit-dependent GTPase A [Eubacteriales bacterium]
MQGKIIRGIGGFYYIHTSCGVYECRARGIFRKDNQKPLPGDRVRIDVLDEEKKEGSIREILPRTNSLIRPAVANVDQAMVIFALASPKPNFNLLDRFLVMMEKQGLPALICFNKKDLADQETVCRVEERYREAGYPLLFVSAAAGEGLDGIRKRLLGRTTTVAGPSGVGKSSLINLLQDNVRMETGAVSEKIERGRHTTRHTELLWVDEDTYILDTPGFSSIDLIGVEKEALGQYFPEIAALEGQCRFAGCSHIAEPDCSVKAALEAGRISAGRYEDYKAFYEELKESQRKGGRSCRIQ